VGDYMDVLVCELGVEVKNISATFKKIDGQSVES